MKASLQISLFSSRMQPNIEINWYKSNIHIIQRFTGYLYTTESTDNGTQSVSDLKFYKIQAIRACNFIRFLARLKSFRSQKSLCQQNCYQRIWNSTSLTCGQSRNCNALHKSDNLLHMVILNNLVILISLGLCRYAFFVPRKFHKMKYFITVFLSYMPISATFTCFNNT